MFTLDLLYVMCLPKPVTNANSLWFVFDAKLELNDFFLLNNKDLLTTLRMELLLRFIAGILKYVGYLVTPIVYLFSSINGYNSRVKIPPIRNDILKWSVVDLAEKIRMKQVLMNKIWTWITICVWWIYTKLFSRVVLLWWCDVNIMIQSGNLQNVFHQL